MCCRGRGEGRGGGHSNQDRVLLTSITYPVFAIFEVALGLGRCKAELHHGTVVMCF